MVVDKLAPVVTDPRDRIVLNEQETQVGIDRLVSQTASCEALDIDDKYGRFSLAATGLRTF